MIPAYTSGGNGGAWEGVVFVVPPVALAHLERPGPEGASLLGYLSARHEGGDQVHDLGGDPRWRWANTVREFVDGVFDVVGKLLHLSGPVLEKGSDGMPPRVVLEEGVDALQLGLEEVDVAAHAGLERVLTTEKRSELLGEGAHEALQHLHGRRC